MVLQKQALDHFNRDKEYEDKLVKDLNFFVIDSLENVKDISSQDKEKVKAILEIIIKDSMRHSVEFNSLIGYVVDNEETDY